MSTPKSSCASLPPTRATPSRHIGIIFRLNKGHLCKDAYVNKLEKCCLWVYLTSLVFAFCKSSKVICSRIFKLQSKLLQFRKKDLYFTTQAVRHFNFCRLEQWLMSLSINFSSPVKHDSKVEQTIYSLTETNSLDRVRRDIVGHSLLIIFSFC